MLLAVSAAPQFAGILEFVEIQNGNTFVYNAKLQNNQYIDDGDYFIVFDFAGLQTGTGPSGWSFSSTNNAAGLANDPSTSDAVFTYTGPKITGVPGNTPLGQFTLTTTSGDSRIGQYLSRTTRTGAGNNADTPLSQSDLVRVAGAGADVQPVPEPAALLLTGLGLSALALGGRYARAKR